MAAVKARSYNSPTRRMQLTATKATVLAAASDVMAKRGYFDTTMDQIAGKAGVAVQTVYKHFGSKAAIVVALIEQARQSQRLVQQRQRLLEAADPVEQVRLIAERARIYAEIGLCVALAFPARALDPELEKALRLEVASIRRSHLEYVRSLQRKGALRKSVSLEEAADYLLVCSPDVFLMVRRDKDWSLDQIERWVAGVLERLLLD